MGNLRARVRGLQSACRQDTTEMQLFKEFLKMSGDGHMLPDIEPEPELDEFSQGIMDELDSCKDPTMEHVGEVGVDEAAKAGKPMYKRFQRWLRGARSL